MRTAGDRLSSTVADPAGTSPWSRSRTVDVGSDFKDMRKSTSCIRHILKGPKASIREVMDEVYLGGLNPC
jgi:hypothetical protein